jgi:hypothetical protein
MNERSGSSMSPVASPRSKATRVNYTSSEYTIITHFVKTNVRLFLRLVSSDIHNTDVSLSASEFNTLRVLFKVEKSSGLKSASTLSSIASFFASASSHSTLKVSMGVIAEWIVSMIAAGDSGT